MKATYEIPQLGYEDLVDKINYLNKRADKLGLSPITIKVLRQDDKEIFDSAEASYRDPMMIGTHDRKDFIKVITYYTVELEGEDPVISGWRFIASLEHTEKGNVIKSLPDVEVPIAYRNNPQRCDHCKIDRRRNKTFVLQHTSGEYKVVGSTCIKDFLGHSDPHILAEYAEGIWSIFCKFQVPITFGYNEYCSNRGGRKISTIGYLSCISAIIRHKGWISIRVSQEELKTSTAETALSLYFGGKDSSGESVTVTDEDRRLVENALLWIRNLSQGILSNGNDYIWNLHVSCSSDYIEYNHSRIVASLITTYQKHLTDIKDVNGSIYLGDVGKSLTIKVKVIACRSFDSAYGVTHVYTLVSGNNQLVWFASKPILDTQKEYTITGKVKDHKEYNGVKQTVLTRCKII